MKTSRRSAQISKFAVFFGLRRRTFPALRYSRFKLRVGDSHYGVGVLFGYANHLLFFRRVRNLSLHNFFVFLCNFLGGENMHFELLYLVCFGGSFFVTKTIVFDWKNDDFRFSGEVGFRRFWGYHGNKK